MKTRRRTLLALSVACLTLLLVPAHAGAAPDEGAGLLPVSGGAGFSFKDVEQCFMRKINRARARRGLRKLNWDRQLGYVARQHSKKLAQAGDVWHDPNLGSKITRWRALPARTPAAGVSAGTSSDPS